MRLRGEAWWAHVFDKGAPSLCENDDNDELASGDIDGDTSFSGYNNSTCIIIFTTYLQLLRCLVVNGR